VRQNSPDKDQKKEEGAVNSLRGLERREERRRSRSGGAPGSGGDGAAVREEERGGVQETQGVVLPLYRAEGEGRGGGGVGARQPAINGGGGSVEGGYREGKGRKVVSGWRRRLNARPVGSRRGAGRPGRRRRGAVRPGLGEEGGGRRWKTHLTGGSHLSARGRERR
jgi:hypothetical protein